MRGKFLAALILLGFATGLWQCAGLEPIQKREEVYGKNAPEITRSFASPQLRPGDTWKVYIEAYDPDGDMKNIVCTIEQAGMGAYPVSITRLQGDHQRDFSGYIYLNTLSFDDLAFVILTLTVQIQDMAGHYSQPVLFPLTLNPTAQQDLPPAGMFQEADLGPIMIQLRTIHDDRGPFDGPSLFFRGRVPFGR